MTARLRIATDIGGTFTDGVAVSESTGRIWVGKCLTTPDDPGEGISSVVGQLLDQISRTEAQSGGSDVVDFVHATTLVTNTLIERNGAKVALILTHGTKDIPNIAREMRYDLYVLDFELPAPLVASDMRFEVDERTLADGKVLKDLEQSDVDAVVDAVAKHKPESVAICFLHSYINPKHEITVRDAITARFPDITVTISSSVAPELGEYERMSTSAANAYVQPRMTSYLGMLKKRLADASIRGNLRIMLSSGGFGSAEAAVQAPIQLLESGPAAGVLSAVNTGAEAGERQILAFDMGGTTAKACVCVDGEPEITHLFETARVHRFKKGSGLPILVPSIDLIEIGAGGGSIASKSHVGTLAVGPQSSGAVPGPACYNRGGLSATVTDADLMLGYLDPHRFLGGEMILSTKMAEEALGRLGQTIGLSAIETAWGICSVVNENMAGAARVHVAEKGFDPRSFTMVATGGAGPVHAVDVARRLRIKTVLSPIAAGAGSCLGLLAASPRADRTWASRRQLKDVSWQDAKRVLQSLQKDARLELDRAGAKSTEIEWLLNLHMRYVGQGHNVEVTLAYEDVGPYLEEKIAKLFAARYQHLYGTLGPRTPPEIITWRLIGRSVQKTRRFEWADGRADRASSKPRTHRPVFQPATRSFVTAPVYDRYTLSPGTKIEGPAILEEREATIVAASACTVTVLEDRTVRIDLKDEA